MRKTAKKKSRQGLPEEPVDTALNRVLEQEAAD